MRREGVKVKKLKHHSSIACNFLSLSGEQAEDALMNLDDARDHYRAINNEAYATACHSTRRRLEDVLAAITDLHNREIDAEERESAQ
jgi:hypothetical protein